jgi:hypothetical protein
MRIVFLGGVVAKDQNSMRFAKFLPGPGVYRGQTTIFEGVLSTIVVCPLAGRAGA